MKRQFIALLLLVLMGNLTPSYAGVCKNLLLSIINKTEAVPQKNYKVSGTISGTQFSFTPTQISQESYPQGWFSNLYPSKTNWGLDTRSYNQQTWGAKVYSLKKTMRYFHGFREIDRYGKQLTDFDVIKIMLETGHPSIQVRKSIERKTGKLFLNSSQVERNNGAEEALKIHYDKLSKSEFGAIHQHLFSNDYPYQSPYISGSTNKQVTDVFAGSRPNSRSGEFSFGYTMEILPNPSSIKLTKLTNSSLHRTVKNAEPGTINFKRPLYQFWPKNSESPYEVIDSIYLPEQIMKISRRDSDGNVIKTFTKDPINKKIVIKDLIEDTEETISYSFNY